MNIIELVTNHLSKDVVGSIGSLIGESSDKTKTALGAAVPALLAGITQLASKPEGALALDAAVSKQDTGILGNLAAAFGSQGSSLTQQGGNLLSSLFGNNLFSGLLGSISNFTGLGQNSARSLLGSLGPLVLSVLSKLKSSSGLDASGLASTLLGQKQNIVSAMPAGLGSALSSVSGLGSFLSSAAGSEVSSAVGAASTNNPKWWKTEHESAWDRVKAAFNRDWEQTKHDLGAHGADIHQSAGDTLKQAVGGPAHEYTEEAYRFGYGARSEYGKRFTKWDDQLEAQLKQDWSEAHQDLDWAAYRDSIRQAWEYEGRQNLGRTP
jgi:hypothetical protein